MEYTKNALSEKPLYPNEYEIASNSYLMAIVAVVAGLPLPIINIIASAIFYLGNLKSSYFIRWHCIQALLAQILLIPFNSLAWAWTLLVILDKKEPTLLFAFYLFGTLLLNILEFAAILSTAAKIRNYKNVRWPVIAAISDMLCSPKNKNQYHI